jgi:hypothetical protein
LGPWSFCHQKECVILKLGLHCARYLIFFENSIQLFQKITVSGMWIHICKVLHRYWEFWTTQKWQIYGSKYKNLALISQLSFCVHHESFVQHNRYVDVTHMIFSQIFLRFKNVVFNFVKGLHGGRGLLSFFAERRSYFPYPHLTPCHTIPSIEPLTLNWQNMTIIMGLHSPYMPLNHISRHLIVDLLYML